MRGTASLALVVLRPQGFYRFWTSDLALRLLLLQDPGQTRQPLQNGRGPRPGRQLPAHGLLDKEGALCKRPIVLHLLRKQPCQPGQEQLVLGSAPQALSEAPQLWVSVAAL